MHILIIPAWYKTPLRPLVGTFFEEQARSLQRRGHKVGIIVPSFAHFESTLKNHYTAYDDNGIYTVTQQVKALVKRSRKINNSYFLFRLFNKAYKNYVKQNGKPDIIHSHVFRYSGVLGVYLAKRKKIPHIFTEHFSLWVNPDLDTSPSEIKDLKSVLSGSVKKFAVSSFLKKGLIKKTELAKDIEVLPNMINDLFFTNTTQTTKSTRFRFINIGSLIAIKNQQMLLRAFADFINKYKVDAELYIVGEGELRNELENEIQALGLENRAYLTGMLDRKSVKIEIQKSHVGVISSVVETFSIAGIEFMSQGLCVVATDCGGPRDYIHDFNGVIVQNETEMATSFYTVYKNHTQYDKEKIVNYVQENFSASSISEKLENIYLNAINEK